MKKNCSQDRQSGGKNIAKMVNDARENRKKISRENKRRLSPKKMELSSVWSKQQSRFFTIGAKKSEKSNTFLTNYPCQIKISCEKQIEQFLRQRKRARTSRRLMEMFWLAIISSINGLRTKLSNWANFMHIRERDGFMIRPFEFPKC